MSKFEVEISKQAERQIAKLPKRDKIKILDTIEELGNEPRPNGYKKLVGFSDFFRYRVGNYRIIYQIADDVLIVTVIEVKRRNESTY